MKRPRRGARASAAESSESSSSSSSGGSDGDMESMKTSPSRSRAGAGARVAAAASNGHEDVSHGGAASGATEPPPRTASPLILPTGMSVGRDDEEEKDGSFEVKRLLRLPRYFDPNFEDTGRRCFKCGEPGHIARDCRNLKRPRPCYRCASLGHTSAYCSNIVCFLCQRTGHVSYECRKVPKGDKEAAMTCVRCGSKTCAATGKPDYVRAEGGCTGEYSSEEMAHVRCASCGRCGHLSCAAVPRSPAGRSCFNCGAAVHIGEECRRIATQWVRRERKRHWPARGFLSQSNPADYKGYYGGVKGYPRESSSHKLDSNGHWVHIPGTHSSTSYDSDTSGDSFPRCRW